MAILQRYTAAEALNTTTSGIWTVKGVLAIAGSGGSTLSTELSSNAHSIIIQAAANIVISFSTSTQNIVAANDLLIDADGTDFVSITVPRGLGNTIYFNAISATDATTCKLIEV